jgi:hypothetical protein
VVLSNQGLGLAKLGGFVQAFVFPNFCPVDPVFCLGPASAARRAFARAILPTPQAWARGVEHGAPRGQDSSRPMMISKHAQESAVRISLV